MATIKATDTLESTAITAEDVSENNFGAIEIEKTTYYINEASKEHKLGVNEVLHWTEIGEDTLYPRSTLLSHIQDDARFLNPLFECRFYTKTADLRPVEVVVDEALVYHRLSEFLATYSKSPLESKELVLKAQSSVNDIRERKMRNELAAIAQKNGLTLDELVSKLKLQ
jgi:hypothetical protein